MDVIEINNLCKCYGDVVAVDDVSLSVEEGEIFGLLGPNGAGKTTTIECAIGLRNFEQGFVRILGLNPLSERHSLYNRIGVQLQQTSFQDKIKVGEICRLFESLYEHPLLSLPLLERFELAGKWNSYVQNLSGGQRQRLSIILALIPNPEIVFLDELTTGLDPNARRSMWDYVKELKEEGKTVFMTTHYMEEAEYLCDRIGIIHKGKIAAYGGVSDVIATCGIYYEITFQSQQNISRLLLDNVSQLVGLEVEGATYTAYGMDQSILGKLVVALETNGIEYTDLDIKRPNLEDAYIKITGSEFLEEVGS